MGQKAPSAKRCIKTAPRRRALTLTIRRQKAPSAIRCIKTSVSCASDHLGRRVRKHRAPLGVLAPLHSVSSHEHVDGQQAGSTIRCIKTSRGRSRSGPRLRSVRKHRAPKGALRHAGRHDSSGCSSSQRQKAPSAIRCIKTRWCRSTCST